MFDFEKLEVYSKAKHFTKVIRGKLKEIKSIDRPIKDQLLRASYPTKYR